MTSLLKIEEYNDPGCPFGYSAEPSRRRIEWLYGDHIEMEQRLVGLQNNPDELLDKGFSTEKMVGGWKKFARENGMPFNFPKLKRHSATVPACRAIVAARVHGGNDRALARWLRIKRFSGELIDEQIVIDAAAKSAGIEPEQLATWTASAVTDKALDSDMHAARHPTPEALAIDRRLADSDDGRRYTCPSWEIERASDGLRVSAPGFQPYDVYEVLLANLLPEVDLRAPAPDPIEVLWWAGEPLATREVAVVMDVSDDEADKALRGSHANEIALESSSFWTQ